MDKFFINDGTNICHFTIVNVHGYPAWTPSKIVYLKNKKAPSLYIHDFFKKRMILKDCMLWKGYWLYINCFSFIKESDFENVQEVFPGSFNIVNTVYYNEYPVIT